MQIKNCCPWPTFFFRVSAFSSPSPSTGPFLISFHCQFRLGLLPPSQVICIKEHSFSQFPRHLGQKAVHSSRQGPNLLQPPQRLMQLLVMATNLSWSECVCGKAIKPLSSQTELQEGSYCHFLRNRPPPPNNHPRFLMFGANLTRPGLSWQWLERKSQDLTRQDNASVKMLLINQAMWKGQLFYLFTTIVYFFACNIWA